MMQGARSSGNSEVFPYEASNVLLGRGGSGAVFLARFIGSHELVAIKRQYTRSGTISHTAASPQRSSSVVRRIESIVEQRSQCNSNTISQYAGSLSSQPVCDGTGPVSAFARELQNEEDAEEESNREVVAWQREEASQPFALVQNGAALCSSASDEEKQVDSGPEDELHILRHLGPHPHIVQCLGDFKSARNVSFLALELMDTDVAKEVQKGNVDLMQEDVCRVMMFSVLLALDFIHSKGVAHRDVKPGNILLKAADKDGSVFVPTSTEGSPHASPTKSRKPYQASLGDFSAAHFMNRVKDKCIAANRGTLYYKAPEQLLSKDIHSYAACDMWALGCTMFEIATGTIAFFGKTELQVQLQIFHRMGSSFDTYPFQTAAPLLFDSMNVSPLFHDLLQHLLVLNPQIRYTAKEALLHPFFTSLRGQYNAASSRLGRSVAMSFPLKLSAPGAKTQSNKLGLVFTPINPAARSRKKTEPSKKVGRRVERSSISPIEPKQSPTSHLVSPESTGFADALDGHNSLLSDGASVHWSQIRSMIGESSSLMDNSAEHRPSGESPAPAPQPRGDARSRNGAAVFSAVRRLPTPSKGQRAPSYTAKNPPQEREEQGQCAADSVSPGERAPSGSGSDNSFALPRVTFSSEAPTLSVEREPSDSLRSNSHKSDEQNDTECRKASVQGAAGFTPLSPLNVNAISAPTQQQQQQMALNRRGRAPVLQEPAKTASNGLAVPQMQSPLDALAATMPGSRAAPSTTATNSMSMTNVQLQMRSQDRAATYRGLFLSDNHSSARDDEERPSSSEQNSLTHLTVGTVPSAFKSLQFESPRPSSGGGSSTDGSSARFTNNNTATAVRPAMRPFVAPAHTIAGRSSSRHRHSGAGPSSQHQTPRLRAHDATGETPSGRSEFMASCCSTVSCSPMRMTASGRVQHSSRSDTSSFFSDPALLATAPPPPPRLEGVAAARDSHPVFTAAPCVTMAASTSGGDAAIAPPPFPLPISLSHSTGGGASVAAQDGPSMPLFMPSTTRTGAPVKRGAPEAVRAVPRPVGLAYAASRDAASMIATSSASVPCDLVAAHPSRPPFMDLTNIQAPPPHYDLFCISSRHRRVAAAPTKLDVASPSSAVVCSPNPRAPTSTRRTTSVMGSPHVSADRDTSKKRPREEEEDMEAPVVRL